MQPHMLPLSILVLSERLHLCRFCITGQSYSTSSNRQHRGKALHLEINKQDESFVKKKLTPLPSLGWDLKEWLGQQISISFVPWIRI